MRTQHVIALSGPSSDPRGIYSIVCSARESGVGNYAALLLLFLRQTAIPLESKLTQNPAAAAREERSRTHTKSPNSLIYARKKVRDLNGDSGAE